MELNSKIKQVTVYRDRALVERNFTCNLSEGNNELIIKQLPKSIDANSIQIYSDDNLILQDVKLKLHSMFVHSDNDKQAVIDNIEATEDSIKLRNDNIENLYETKKMLTKFVSKLYLASKQTLANLFDTEKISKTLEFYNVELNKTANSIRAEEKELAKLEEQLKIYKQSIDNIDYQDIRQENRLSIKIFSESKVTSTISFSYIVGNAWWEAVYDIRLNSEQKKFTIGYNAIVKQSTGEDWKDVKLKLSTAQMQFSGSVPNINAWYLNEQQYNYNDYTHMEDTQMLPLTAGETPPAKRKRSRKVMQSVQAMIEDASTSVMFNLDGLHTISANNEEHKTSITQLQFDAELKYLSVPKLSPTSYLTAKTINESSFPFMSGKTNIFLDNNFVSNSTMKFIAPKEEFECYLGIDQNIKIEHKLIKKYKKEEGLLNKKTKIIYEYQTEITNNKATDCQISLQDQIPVSQNKDIKVELINPKIKDNSETLSIDSSGIIDITIHLQSRETTHFDLKFSVEYPKEMSISGL